MKNWLKNTSPPSADKSEIQKGGTRRKIEFRRRKIEHRTFNIERSTFNPPMAEIKENRVG